MKVFIVTVDKTQAMAVIACNSVDAYKIAGRMFDPECLHIEEDAGYELILDAIGLGEAGLETFGNFLSKKLHAIANKF